MENNSSKLDKVLKISIILAALSIVYYFAIRPIQRDYKLEECLYGAGVTLNAGELYENYAKTCMTKYGN